VDILKSTEGFRKKRWLLRKFRIIGPLYPAVVILKNG